MSRRDRVLVKFFMYLSIFFCLAGQIHLTRTAVPLKNGQGSQNFAFLFLSLAWIRVEVMNFFKRKCGYLAGLPHCPAACSSRQAGCFTPGLVAVLGFTFFFFFFF